MKALILNSGIGKRMGEFTKDNCKCMVQLLDGVTILDDQMKKLIAAGIKDFCITTGPFAGMLEKYARDNYTNINIEFIHNPIYAETNYIYSIYLARQYLFDDLLLLHGDLVFDSRVIDMALTNANSVMVVDSSLPLPKKDFKATVINDRIKKIGTNVFEEALAAQPFYKLNRNDWLVWLDEIVDFCKKGITSVYAENAFNNVNEDLNLFAMDINGLFCGEIDNMDDLHNVRMIYPSIN